MSHTVTVTRTTTTTSTSAILLNVGYFRTLPGILKVLHIILGIICVAIAGNYISYHKSYSLQRISPHDYMLFVPELFFLLIATTCMIASTLLLVSCVISIATATILPKTVFEVVYHLVAAILLLIASIVYVVKVNSSYNSYSSYSSQKTPFQARLAAGEITFIPPLIFLLSVSSIHLIRSVVERNALYDIEPNEPGYVPKIFAGILGLVNSILYGVATFFAHRNFKSG